ncbi:protein kinase domain-containing protein [Acinetobacter sp. A47]|uniref:protein kinase domain-containing protein n=1 Tax=Acinetobacter sp. A47 TaxID=1561217 RepID=UPI000570E344|nr:protein kinase [Acinetobacter sp. A47]
MSSTTWIFDPEIQPENLTLVTKAKSYAFGRRLYRCDINQQRHWLKFHQFNTQPDLEQAFLRELDFYRQPGNGHSILLPHRLVPIRPFKHLLEATGAEIGLLTVDAPSDFFPPLNHNLDIGLIRQQLLKALDSLDALHQAGWIHGDLKAEHFRLYDGNCTLIDFEQCLRIGQSIQRLEATPRYMAPELFHGAGKSIQSDLYAFGIIVYEWLSRNRLQARTYHDWALLHCQHLQIGLPEQLQVFLPLLQGLLQKHIQQRFLSVAAVKNGLNSTFSL